MQRTTSLLSVLVLVCCAACTAEESNAPPELIDDMTQTAATVDPSCHHIQGRYALEPNVEGCSAPSGCYDGVLTGAGFFNGTVHLGIVERFEGILTGAIVSYAAESEATTKHGTVSFNHVGHLGYPDSDLEVTQTDMMWVTGGTGRFASASGHLWATGTANFVPAVTGFAGLSGMIYGELCLGPE